jgi:hypothetical protein
MRRSEFIRDAFQAEPDSRRSEFIRDAFQAEPDSRRSEFIRDEARAVPGEVSGCPLRDTLETSLCAPRLFPTSDAPGQGSLTPPSALNGTGRDLAVARRVGYLYAGPSSCLEQSRSAQGRLERVLRTGTRSLSRHSIEPSRMNSLLQPFIHRARVVRG